MDANAFSLRPAKPVAARFVSSGDKIRSIIIVVDQIAAFSIACKKVSHLPSPPSAHLASYWSEDAHDSIGNRGELPRSLIALQLSFFEVGTLSGGLVSSAPE